MAGETAYHCFKTMVNGKGPFIFIVDTGASHTVITNKTVKKLEIPQRNRMLRINPRTQRKGAGGVVTALTTMVISIRVDDTGKKR